MSQGKRGGRFSYLTSTTQSEQTPAPTDAEREQENTGSTALERDEPSTKPTSGGRGAAGRSPAKQRRSATRTSETQELASVPKGKGRMKQERSQLNVRLPTTLKRQASAKAVLEGRDIGEVVEEFLREYLDR